MRPPKIIKPYVISFCRQIVKKPEPIYIPVRPLNGAPANECFQILPKHIASHGGEQVIGWTIWEWPRVLIEAEFHCIWRRPDNRLLDLTPKSVPVPRILFLPDARRAYRGRQVDNVRKPLDHDPAIRRFCDLATRLHHALNEGELADYHGPVELSEEATRDELEKRELKRVLVRRYGANAPEVIAP
jgi:hypothetical protein